jgi:transcriptional regulator with XRE-family HTH domain
MANEIYSHYLAPNFEERFRKYMAFNRLTYKDIMMSLEISKATAYNLLSGKHKPSKNVVDKIHSSLNGVDINWLLYGEENQPQNANSVTHSVTPHTYKSGVTEYNTTAIQPPPPPPPPPPGSSDEDVFRVHQQYKEIIDNQAKTIAFLQQHVNQLTEQNKSIMELFKLGKYNAVTFTGPQAFPNFSIYNGNSVTLAVTAERIAA